MPHAPACDDGAPPPTRRTALSARGRLPALCGLTLAALLGQGASAATPAPRPAAAQRFLVYYGRPAHDGIRRYDLAILDSDIAAEIAACRGAGATVLGYLSLGEIHGSRDYVEELDAAGLLLDANPAWPDARFVDMRQPGWRERVLARIVPAILARGFDGLFFDTLDAAEALQLRDPVRFHGMVEAAAGLVRAVRRAFPGVPVMVNRGYAVLPRIAGQFDMLLGESVRSTFDAGSGAYRLVAEDGFRWQVERMRIAQARDPRLKLYSLDYWNPEERDRIAWIYAAQRANGFVPYVATFDLNRIVPEP